MATKPGYLVEIDAIVSGSPTTLRVSTDGYTSRPDDTPANTHYLEVVSDPGTFTRHLFERGQTRGLSEIELGEVVLVNVDGVLDGWRDYAIAGQELRVYRIASRSAALSTATLALRASVEGLDWSLRALTLRLRGRRLDLDRPLQTTRYAGTTTSGGATAEGTADLKDVPKPLVFGKVFNVPAVQANAFDLIYQVSDGAVASIQVYDGGVQLTAASDRADLAALQGATIAAGRFDTCLALGLFRLGASPAGQVTADVSEGATAADRYPGAVAQRILDRAGIDAGDIDGDSFDDLDTAAGYEVGIFVSGDDSALAVLRQVVQSVGGWVSPDETGTFFAGRMAAPGTSIGDLDSDSIQTEDPRLGLNPDTDGIPPWRIVLRHSRNWQVQDGQQVYGCVSQSRRTFLSRVWREARDDDEAIKTSHPLSAELTIETLLTDADDAAAEATRLLALYGTDRDQLSEVPVLRTDAAGMIPGATVTVTLPRLGFEAGRDMVVIGRRERLGDELVDLTLWG